ncbi:MAG: hypothetical protein N3A72_02160 [bacterium]|nr:hypothetical protein [bacterium]
MAIVEQGTVCIDSYHQNTGDKAFYQGHYYSDKGPFPAFLGVPIYWLLSKLFTKMEPQLGFAGHRQVNLLIWFTKLVIIRILVISALSALLAIVLYRFLLRLGTEPKLAILLTIGYGLGTLAFPYSTLFYGHQLAAALIFMSFYILYNLKHPIQNISYKKSNVCYLISGLLCGLAILTEYPVVLLVVVLFFYAFPIYTQQSAFRNILWFLLGFVGPIAVLFYYNYLCFGFPFTFGYFSVADENFRQQMAKGIAGITYPKADALVGITFSAYRGLFFINPLLLLSIFGFYYFYQKQETRNEFRFILVAFIIYLLFNASYYMWWGGWTIGPRHLIPIIPFLIIPIAFIPLNTSKCFKPYLLYILCMISILFMVIGTVVDPQVPDTIRRLSWSPLFGYSLPKFLSGDFYANLGTVLGLNGLASILPLLIVMVIGISHLIYLAKRAT